MKYPAYRKDREELLEAIEEARARLSFIEGRATLIMDNLLGKVDPDELDFQMPSFLVRGLFGPSAQDKDMDDVMAEIVRLKSVEDKFNKLMHSMKQLSRLGKCIQEGLDL